MNLIKLVLALLLVFAGAALYFVLVLAFGWWQPIPWVAFVCMGIGCVWLIVQAASRPGVLSIGTTAVGLAFSGLFVWWALFFSSYDEAAEPGNGIAIAGDPAMTATLEKAKLVDASGAPVEPKTLLTPSAGKAAKLLVFYRGYW